MQRTSKIYIAGHRGTVGSAIVRELKRHVYGLGRWGEHNHYNSDMTAELAMSLAEKI